MSWPGVRELDVLETSNGQEISSYFKDVNNDYTGKIITEPTTESLDTFKLE